MKRIKTILLKGLAAVMAILLCVSATGCFLFEKSEAQKEQDFISLLGGVSETFKGAISNQAYDTAEKAANAYVQEQVVGEKTATVVNTKSNGALTQAEVSNLNLPQEVKEGIVSVEEMEVEYSANNVSYSSTNTQKSKIKVYVIKYENDWKYYTPAPITGETISKSYYDSVFDFNKYKNCTFTAKLKINMNIMLFLNLETIVTQTMKFDNNKIYIEQTMTAKSFEETESETICAYIEQNGSSITCFAKGTQTRFQWVSASLSQIGFHSIEELTPFYRSYLDYTYFTKTDYGFRMADEQAQQYISESFARENFGNMQLGKDVNMDMFVKYYVSNGILSGMREDASFSMNFEEGGETVKSDMKITGESYCYDFGTTKVNKAEILY